MEIKLVAYIRRNATGEVRKYETTDTNDIGIVEYAWTDGNYGTDMNRSLFFERAGGTVGEDYFGEGAYSVRLSTADGRAILAEF